MAWLADERWIAAIPLVALLTIGLCEHFATWRTPGLSLGRRWIANFSFIGLNSLLVRFLLPAGVAGAVLYLEGRGFILVTWPNWPSWAVVAVGFVMLDAVAYGVHRLTHAVHAFWRLHAVHHADPEIDVTTGFRHHPGEILVSAVGTLVAAILFGIPALAVAIYGVIAPVFQLAQHANARVPVALDRLLRWMVMTPDVHRLHHSRDFVESNRNYGAVLIWWDRLCGTYLPSSKSSPHELQFGLDGFSDVRDLAPWRALAMPFRVRKADGARAARMG